MFPSRILFLLVLLLVSLSHSMPQRAVQNKLWSSSSDLLKSSQIHHHRDKRGLDLVLGAEHEQNVGTDVSVEALLNVWKSEDENTRVDASATYSQHFGLDNYNAHPPNYGIKINIQFL